VYPDTFRGEIRPVQRGSSRLSVARPDASINVDVRLSVPVPFIFSKERNHTTATGSDRRDVTSIHQMKRRYQSYQFVISNNTLYNSVVFIVFCLKRREQRGQLLERQPLPLDRRLHPVIVECSIRVVVHNR